MRRIAATVLLLMAVLSGCGAVGHPSPEAAVLANIDQQASSGLRLEGIGSTPVGTLAVYSYIHSQTGHCRIAWGIAEQHNGRWIAYAGGQSSGPCSGGGQAGPVTVTNMSVGNQQQPGSLTLGVIRDPTVASIEVEWEDGTMGRATISGGMYYMYHRADARPVLVTAYDDNGDEVGSVQH